MWVLVYSQLKQQDDDQCLRSQSCTRGSSVSSLLCSTVFCTPATEFLSLRPCCVSDSLEMWPICDRGIYSEVQKNSRGILSFIQFYYYLSSCWCRNFETNGQGRIESIGKLVDVKSQDFQGERKIQI